MADHDSIVYAKIHPAIGIARVGNSAEEYFLGPEVVFPTPQPAGFYKDSAGALKRQAARFRIYGYSANGEVVDELDVDNAVIEWAVHVANSKAAWYEFQRALDLPDDELADALPSRRRNATVTGTDRTKLVIDPGARSIHGRGTSGSEYFFDTGKFFDKAVYLGELQTDHRGRLLVLGGRGVSASITGQVPMDFANNDGWHDDVSDGPVTARLWLDGREVPVEGSWVIVGPPNYAPTVHSVRTLYDLLYDLFITIGWLPEPSSVSFAEHIQPVFERLCNLQWVNGGFFNEFGHGATNNFVRSRLMERLADTSVSNREFRTLIASKFRNYDTNNSWIGLWPWIYGDAMDQPQYKHSYLALSGMQLKWLGQWAAGNFIADYNADATPTRRLSDLSLESRPAMLDRAALTYCVADAFHPGCEVTWTVRRRLMYRFPFRIRHRPSNQPVPDFGDTLTKGVALDMNGPLNGAGPGDITRWMAVPWQTDTASCLSGYSFSRLTPFTPTFWPARVPNQVLTDHHYEIAIDESRDLGERVRAFRTREDWYRGFQSRSYLDDIAQMISDFGKLGIVEVREGASNQEGLPEVMLVESQPNLLLPPPLDVSTSLPTAASHAARLPKQNPRRRGLLNRNPASTSSQ